MESCAEAEHRYLLRLSGACERPCRVGKTRLCQLFVARAYPHSTNPTVVADLFIKEASVGSRPVIVQVRS